MENRQERNLYTVVYLFNTFCHMKLIAAVLSFTLFCAFVVKEPLTGSKVSAEDAKKALEIHNAARKKVGVPALQWSPELARYAQAWAEELAATKCDLDHRPKSGKWKQLYGENLYWSSDAATVMDACNSWMEEQKDFKNKPVVSGDKGTGHYSQMIWSTTTKLGMGLAACKDGSVIVVANYDPPGNYIGKKAY
jgi:uncharacterized protein YkwD